jgi:hypothetical protein
MADIKNIKNLKIDGVTYNIIDDEAARLSTVNELTDQVDQLIDQANELLAPVLTIDSNTPSSDGLGGSKSYRQEIASNELLRNYADGFRVRITYSIGDSTYKDILLGTVAYRSILSSQYRVILGSSDQEY